MNGFQRFCNIFQLTAYPAQLQTLVLFVTYKTVILRHSVSSTLNSLSTVRRFHLAAGVDLPTPSSHFPLKEAIRGARRFLSKPTVQKLPMYPTLLCALVGGTAWGSPWRCLYLTLWLTFSRLASLIPTTGQFDPAAHLTWSNITFYSNAVKVVLDKTKTIQCKERNLQFIIPIHNNSSVCLLTQMKAWFNLSPYKQGDDPVFVVCHNGVWQPLNRTLADQAFKSALAGLGVNPSSYGFSSFRRGASTTGFLATGDVETLREHGDWKSNAYVRYLALPADKRTNLVKALQNSLS